MNLLLAAAGDNLAGALGGTLGFFLALVILVFGVCLLVCWAILPFIIMSKLGKIERQMNLSNTHAEHAIYELRAIRAYYSAAAAQPPAE